MRISRRLHSRDARPLTRNLELLARHPERRRASTSEIGEGERGEEGYSHKPCSLSTNCDSMTANVEFGSVRCGLRTEWGISARKLKEPCAYAVRYGGCLPVNSANEEITAFTAPPSRMGS